MNWNTEYFQPTKNKGVSHEAHNHVSRHRNRRCKPAGRHRCLCSAERPAPGFFKWYGFDGSHLIRACGVREAGEVVAHTEVMTLAEDLAKELCNGH